MQEQQVEAVRRVGRADFGRREHGRAAGEHSFVKGRRKTGSPARGFLDERVGHEHARQEPLQAVWPGVQRIFDDHEGGVVVLEQLPP